jgi:hypothetical protein
MLENDIGKYNSTAKILGGLSMEFNENDERQVKNIVRKYGRDFLKKLFTPAEQFDDVILYILKIMIAYQLTKDDKVLTNANTLIKKVYDEMLYERLLEKTISTGKSVAELTTTFTKDVATKYQGKEPSKSGEQNFAFNTATTGAAALLKKLTEVATKKGKKGQKGGYTTDPYSDDEYSDYDDSDLNNNSDSDTAPYSDFENDYDTDPYSDYDSEPNTDPYSD